jgi:hypothetical protein
MPTYVYMSNYRGFANELVPLSRVNFLVGENSTGKTSFLDLLKVFSYPPFWLFEPRFEQQVPTNRHFLDLVSAASKHKNSFVVGALLVSTDNIKDDFGMITTYENNDGRPSASCVSMIQGGVLRSVKGRLWDYRTSTKPLARTKRVEKKFLSADASSRAKRYVQLHSALSGYSELELKKDECLFLKGFAAHFLKMVNSGQKFLLRL